MGLFVTVEVNLAKFQIIAHSLQIQFSFFPFNTKALENFGISTELRHYFLAELLQLALHRQLIPIRSVTAP